MTWSKATSVDVLLISPERFANPRFVDNLLPLLMRKLGLLVVDEAHCISDWGHDFRPDYQRLAHIIGQLPPNSPLLATTATANDRVVADVVAQLGDVRVSRGRLARENLALQVMPTMSAVERLAWLAGAIPALPGKGIVYTLTRADAERVATWLKGRGVSAHAYYSDVVANGFPETSDAKRWLEDEFTSGDLKVLVATTALGMGYDNPDVRFVFHYQAPSSIIAYYQQVGRAGRGREGAVGVLMSGPEDAAIHERFRTSSLPTAGDVVSILGKLAEHDGLILSQLLSMLNMPRGRLDQALRYLSVRRPAPVIRDGTTWRRTPVKWNPAYADERDALIDLRLQEWDEIQAYRRQKTGCLMRTLLVALDDPAPPDRCGICQHCRGDVPIAREPDPDLMHEAYRFIHRLAANVIAPRQQIPKGSMPVYGFPTRIPANLQAEAGRALGHAGDDSIGDRVMLSKTIGSFEPDLIDAAAAFIRDTWRPDPAPTWIAFVPSRRHPTLVPSLAHDLAEKLGVPCREVIAKVRDTEEQKLQENSAHQCGNLDGAFEIVGTTDSGPVLLVDDVVDSGWTMTVLATLLRQAGSGPVLPFAMASSRPRDATA